MLSHEQTPVGSFTMKYHADKFYKFQWKKKTLGNFQASNDWKFWRKMT